MIPYINKFTDQAASTACQYQKPKMTIENIDKLFEFLYKKGHEYTRFAVIQSECFPKDATMDVEGMTLKMHKDGYLDSGAIRNHAIISGYTQKGNYKCNYSAQ